MKTKWKWDKLFKEARKKYTPEQLEEMLQQQFVSKLMSTIENELFEYEIIKKHDYKSIGFLSYFATWMGPSFYIDAKGSTEATNKLEQLSPHTIMTYDKIKKLKKQHDELNRKEFELLSRIDFKKVEGYNKKTKRIEKGGSK